MLHPLCNPWLSSTTGGKTNSGANWTTGWVGTTTEPPVVRSTGRSVSLVAGTDPSAAATRLAVWQGPTDEQRRHLIAERLKAFSEGLRSVCKASPDARPANTTAAICWRLFGTPKRILSFHLRRYRAPYGYKGGYMEILGEKRNAPLGDAGEAFSLQWLLAVATVRSAERGRFELDIWPFLIAPRGCF